MKRILIDANPSANFLATGHISGISRTNMELIQALSLVRDSLDFEITLYSQNLKGVSAKRLNSGFKTIHSYLRNNSSWNELAKIMRVRELLGRYDLQHITHNFENITDPSKCIVTIHDVMFLSYPEAQVCPECNRRLIPPFARSACHIITISENSKREIMKYMNVSEERISVIHWGIDHKSLYPHCVPTNRFCDNKPYFISVSCDTGRKNTISVLRAYQKFALDFPKHHLILVWRRPSEEAIQLIKEYGLEKRVHFASNISNEELADLYAGATASFFPSLYEGFGLPIAESMACGVPCVTCRNSSLEEVGGEAAIYVDPLDTDAMAEIMANFENHNFDMDVLRQASIIQASKFTWEECAKKTIEVYHKCLGL